MAKSGGRPLPKVVEDNFDRLEDVPNSSNRSYFKCKHCPLNSPGAHIENRDNNLPKHLTDAAQCPNCPPGERDLLTGPEDISVDEIDAEFDALEKQNAIEKFKDVDIDGLEILEGNVYNFDELARVEAGMVPKSMDEEFSVIDHGARGEEGGWDVASILSTNGFL
ncbi:hypothetical protein P692DRAFT_201858758 [Suillus brevipes Sb2]|nr:hypothetical protein P692DRAFT_201858758 [Suillus brevipes Sb2]